MKRRVRAVFHQYNDYSIVGRNVDEYYAKLERSEPYWLCKRIDKTNFEKLLELLRQGETPYIEDVDAWEDK